jgi:hypothetical protein
MRNRLEDFGRIFEIAKRVRENPLLDLYPDEKGEFDKTNEEIHRMILNLYREINFIYWIAKGKHEVD